MNEDSPTIRNNVEFSVDYHLKGHEKYVRRCAHYIDLNLLVSCSHDGSVRVWDLITRKEVHKFTVFEKDVADMIEMDDNIVLCSSFDNNLPLASFDIKYLEVKKFFRPNSSNVVLSNSSAVPEKVHSLIGIGTSPIVSLMKIKNYIFPHHEEDETFLMVTLRGQIFIINYTEGEIIRRLRSVTDVFNYSTLLDFSNFSPRHPTSFFIQLGGSTVINHRIILYDFLENKTVKEFRNGHSKYIHCIDLIRGRNDDEDENLLISCGGIEKTIVFWSIKLGFILKRYKSLNWIFSIMPISNQYLVIGEDMGVIELLNLKNNEMSKFRKFDHRLFDRKLIHFRLKNLIPSQQLITSGKKSYEVRILRFVSAGKTIRGINVDELGDKDQIERSLFLLDSDFHENNSCCFVKIQMRYSHLHMNRLFFI